MPGAVGLDVSPHTQADIIHDLNVFPYPFADNEWDEIICRHVLEHLTDFLRSLEELYRITKPNGVIKIWTPHYSSVFSFTDPTHRYHFSSFTFELLEPERTRSPLPTEARFRLRKLQVRMHSLYRLLGLELVVNHWRAFRQFWERYLCFLLRAREIYVELVPLKEGKSG